MQDRSDKLFDQQFRAKFENFAPEPDAHLWQQINEQLDKPRSKRRPIVWLIAASVLMIGAASVWFSIPAYQPQYTQLQDRPTAPSAVQKVQQGDLAVKQGASISNEAQHIAAAFPQHRQLTKQAKAEIFTSISADQNTASQTASPTVSFAEEPVAATVLPIESQTFAAVTPSVQENNVEEEEQPKSKLSGLGKLVNFVVSRVDRREDKLIEVSEERGEGLKITGLNLGFVKMKNK